MSDQYTLTAKKSVLEQLCKQHFLNKGVEYYNKMINTLQKCIKNNTFDDESTKMLMKEIFPILNELSSAVIKKFLEVLDHLLLQMYYYKLPVEQMLKQTGFFLQCVNYVDKCTQQQYKKTE
ncbi:Hypothetical_protein [Hexamita inflata]|uniref:Hypothetical_protein n=1 Tax=Hexamita inflata TaxID=28002 RepID=A0AA86NQ43_9EUKA|nr:Hypothetical protein HINF_LOCUS11317 [Hexamita inflata]